MQIILCISKNLHWLHTLWWDFSITDSKCYRLHKHKDIFHVKIGFSLQNMTNSINSGKWSILRIWMCVSVCCILLSLDRVMFAQNIFVDINEIVFSIWENPSNKNMFLDFETGMLLPKAPPVRVVSFREELPEWLVHYHHGDGQRGCRLKMAPSPVRHCRHLLLEGISLGWRGRQGLCWVGLVKDKIRVLFNTFTKKKSSLLTTFMTLRAEIELRKLHIGSEFFWVDLADFFKPRQHGLLWVSDIQVVHSQDCNKKSPRMKIDSNISHCVLTAFPLTHVVCDNGERLQVGFPDILSQGVGVVFKVAEQVGSTTFGPLDLIPVLLVGRIQ